ncbi:DnaJ subfamily B member 11 [Tetrabaena socialis]|uniref:DnaJ subfamily B member 11 n=1 Tax=Tetrabaena socialis TaxID=47790 RepID=A0A2J8AJ13_9CHLO|nr:DnaJ subfamily B member 11 [Tetrabaena socialis]|eukprot:PNH12507.1 DnaJ subfamily B member 11 [Tetrabaena socialis]
MPPKKPSSRAAAADGQDLYKELGLAPNASVDDIKRAYRQLALQCHPDKCPGDQAAQERFQRVSVAYSVLSDASKRRFYDDTGTTEGLDISPEEFLDMFQALLLEIIGGADMIREMLSCFTPRELARLPPFPFPKELFPAGTFPPGLRFSSKGLKGMPPQLEAMIQNGDLASLFSAASGADSPSFGRGGAGASRAEANTRRKLFGAGGGMAAGGLYGHGGRAGGGGGGAVGRGGGGEAGDGSDDDSGDSSGDWTDVSDSELEALWAGAGGEAGGGSEGLQPAGRAQQPQPDVADPLPQQPAQPQPHSNGSQARRSTQIQHPQPQPQQPQQPQPPPPPQPEQQQPPQPQQQLLRDWMTAARCCDVGSLEGLLAAEPALLCSRGSGLGHTALHWCAAKGSVEAVGWLLQQGAEGAAVTVGGAAAAAASGLRAGWGWCSRLSLRLAA